MYDYRETVIMIFHGLDIGGELANLLLATYRVISNFGVS